MRVTFSLLLIVLLITPVTAQTTDKPFESLEDNEFNFKITETAEFTNYLDQSILITVEGNKEQSFSIQQTGLNTTQGTWIWGINQTSIENHVNMGILYDSGFNASSIPNKSATVSPFNLTTTPPSEYNQSIHLIPVTFVKDHSLNVSLVDNSTMYTPFITFNQPFFVLSTDEYLGNLDSVVQSHIQDLSLPVDSAEVTLDGTSLEYRVSGEMIDIHHFTHHPVGVQSVSDYNNIEFSGGFSVSYDSNKVLNEYLAEYEIIYNDVTIMEYSYFIRVRSGSGGNINLGDAGITSGFDFTIVLLALIIIPTTIRFKRSISN